jgi:hypothetical protein
VAAGDLVIVVCVVVEKCASEVAAMIRMSGEVMAWYIKIYGRKLVNAESQRGNCLLNQSAQNQAMLWPS